MKRPPNEAKKGDKLHFSFKNMQNGPLLDFRRLAVFKTYDRLF